MPDLSKIVRLLNGKDRNVKLYPDTLARRVFRSNGQNVDVALHNLEEESVSKDQLEEELTKLPKDVQINGTSILDENKVANIPLAKQQGLGISYPHASRGIAILADGGLFINKATESAINGKESSYLPIVPANLDYAVKSGLADSNIEWSDEEKAKARERLGVDSSGAVDDVQVDGVSVLGDDNIAKIPRASSDASGTIKIGNGTQLTSAGAIRATALTKANYDSANGNTFVGKTTLENIKSDVVRRALADDTQDEWTEEDKASAREILGAGSSDDVAKANAVINGTGIEITDFSEFEHTKRNWTIETSETGAETYIESDYEDEEYYNIIIPNNNYDTFMFNKTSASGAHIALCNGNDKISKAYLYPANVDTAITVIPSNIKYFILRAKTTTNYLPKSIVFNKTYGIAEDYISKNASQDQVLTCRLRVGTPSLNLSNAFLHMRYLPNIVDERGRTLYGACFAVGLNGYAELQSKSYGANGTAGRNEAVMRISRDGIKYASNQTSSSVPPESDYKELAIAEYLSLSKDGDSIVLKYRDTEISRVSINDVD